MTDAADLGQRPGKAHIAALLGQHIPPGGAVEAPAAADAGLPPCGSHGVATALSAAEETRVRLGAAGDTPPDVLAALAVDPAVMVRAAVAMNSAAPAEADTRLARDSDERVRVLLARRMAAVIPDLADDQRDHLQAHALAVLRALVADEAVRVREAIADVVKDMPQAPRDLILRLARDAAFSVSEPVIRLSPLLTAEDLLALIAAPPTPGARTAIARRRGLNERVSDAIAAGTDPAAITALLENHSASIREATLDSLIARAPGQSSWQEALSRRPALSGYSVRALSQIVTTHLLRALAERVDLDRETAAELRQRLTDRLQPRSAAEVPDPLPGIEEVIAEARALSRADLLNERRVLDTVAQGDVRRASAMLAVAAGVELSIVEKAAHLRNAKALVALVWRAGFTMRLGTSLQTLLGLGPDQSLRANLSGGFPLGPDEMRWQIDCLLRGSR